jgi:protoporphyrinogen oxidase
MIYKKNDVLILGAGVAGLSSAKRLQENGIDFAVLEKRESVGGLAITYSIQEGDLQFRVDNGPHLFQYGIGDVSKFVEGIIPKESIIHIKLIERIVINDKTLDFPIVPKQMLKTFGFVFILKVLMDYNIAVLKYKILRKPVSNFFDFVEINLGKTLANITSLSYLEKVFGIPSEEIHVDLAKQRFTFLSLSKYLKEFVNNLIRARSFGTNIRDSTVMAIYPKSGIGIFSEIMKTQIEEGGNPIYLNSYVKKLFHRKHSFTNAIAMINGEETNIDLNYVIESIPIGDFIRLIEPAPPSHVVEASSKLYYRNQVYLFITFDLDRITKYHSYYFSNGQIPFSRVTEMKNFDTEMSPSGKTSLMVEFFCNKDDEIFNMTTDEIFDYTFPFIEKYYYLKRSMVRNYYKFTLEKAYPIYDISYKENLKIIKEYLNSFDNLSYVGRTGKFEYISQPRSIEMGLEAAKSAMNRLAIRERID